MTSEAAPRTAKEIAMNRCDRVVDNGFGEPTECGRTLPCEYHPTRRFGRKYGEGGRGPKPQGAGQPPSTLPHAKP